MKAARKTVEIFSPEELDIIIESTRNVWLPSIVLSAYAGIQTFEMFRLK